MPVAFAVLAEPHRCEILNVLRDGEASVGELVAQVGLSQPGVSKHLRRLREAGMVVARVDRQQRLYRLDPGPLRELDEWLAPYRRHWSATLDSLGDHLDATRPRAQPTTTDGGKTASRRSERPRARSSGTATACASNSPGPTPTQSSAYGRR